MATARVPLKVTREKRAAPPTAWPAVSLTSAAREPQLVEASGGLPELHEPVVLLQRAFFRGDGSTSFPAGPINPGEHVSLNQQNESTMDAREVETSSMFADSAIVTLRDWCAKHNHFVPTREFLVPTNRTGRTELVKPFYGSFLLLFGHHQGTLPKRQCLQKPARDRRWCDIRDPSRETLLTTSERLRLRGPMAGTQLGVLLLQSRQPTVQLFGGKVRAEREFPRAGDRRADKIPHLGGVGGRPDDELVGAPPLSLYVRPCLKCTLVGSGDLLAQFFQQGGVSVGHPASLAACRRSLPGLMVQEIMVQEMLSGELKSNRNDKVRYKYRPDGRQEFWDAAVFARDLSRHEQQSNQRDDCDVAHAVILADSRPFRTSAQCQITSKTAPPQRSAVIATMNIKSVLGDVRAWLLACSAICGGGDGSR